MKDNSNQPNQKIALEERARSGEKLYSPSTARNRGPICDVLLQLLPEQGEVLEIGGGTGEHAIHFAKAAPHITWRTGDPDVRSRRSMAAWINESGLSNITGPHAIDVTTDDWGINGAQCFVGLVSINMVHIAPFAAAKGLFAGAGRLLQCDGFLFLYGPFSRNGAHTAPSNDAFDKSLKQRNQEWGVRDIEQDLLPLAAENNLELESVVDMPANNFSLIFRKVASPLNIGD